ARLTSVPGAGQQLRRRLQALRFSSARPPPKHTAITQEESSMTQPIIGVSGGSGLYTMEGLEGAEWRAVASPFGAPSDSILTGRLNGMAMAFLPRHGRGHVHSPSSVPYRANID